MEIFISWSGDRSQKVAEALRDWLPSVLQSVRPFMSATDIDKGSRWADDLAVHLDEAQYGLICLTQENLEAPWLLFEAGALSKSIQNSRVVPYLYGVSQADLQGPLAQFQAASADESSTLDVIKSINEVSEENALETARLESAFETWWPRLKGILDNIPKPTEEAPPSRTDRDILEEILRLSRRNSRRDGPDAELDHEVLRNIMAHSFPTEPGDPTEDLDPETLNRRISQSRQFGDARRMARHRRLREHERLLHRREVNPQTDSSSEGEA